MTRNAAPATDLEITVDQDEEGSTVWLRGRLNLDSSPDLRDRLLALLRTPSARAVTIDMEGLAYIDSSGMATLIEALKTARQQQTTLCLRGLQGGLLVLFQASGISTLFEQNGCGSVSSVSKVS